DGKLTSHAIHSIRSESGISGRIDNLTDAFVIKPDRDAPRSNEHGNAVAVDRGARMIDLEALTAVQFNCEDAKRRSRQHRFQQLIKILRRHWHSPRLAAQSTYSISRRR